MTNKVLAIIQARMGSTRLPGKVLLPLAGKSVLEHVIMRVQKAEKVSRIIVATSISKDNERIVDACKRLSVGIFRGSEEDVLDRFYRASLTIRPDHVIRITADCPMIDPEVIDNVISRHLKDKADYTSNTIEFTYPDGEDVEIFKMIALKEAWKNAKLSSQREHVTPYIKANPQIFKILNVAYRINLSKKRWTLDQEKDYRFLIKIFDNLYPSNHFFGMDEILKFLEKNPRIKKINSGIARNEGYLKSLKKDKTIKNG